MVLDFVAYLLNLFKSTVLWLFTVFLPFSDDIEVPLITFYILPTLIGAFIFFVKKTGGIFKNSSRKDK